MNEIREGKRECEWVISRTRTTSQGFKVSAGRYLWSAASRACGVCGSSFLFLDSKRVNPSLRPVETISGSGEESDGNGHALLLIVILNLPRTGVLSKVEMAVSIILAVIRKCFNLSHLANMKGKEKRKWNDESQLL